MGRKQSKRTTPKLASSPYIEYIIQCIKKIREDYKISTGKELTTEDISKKCNITKSYIYQILNKKSPPSEELLVCLVKNFYNEDKIMLAKMLDAYYSERSVFYKKYLSDLINISDMFTVFVPDNVKKMIIEDARKAGLDIKNVPDVFGITSKNAIVTRSQLIQLAKTLNTDPNKYLVAAGFLPDGFSNDLIDLVDILSKLDKLPKTTKKHILRIFKDIVDLATKG